ncbi:hypothetical protein MRX96_030755 [Rhipicephalus microplus]
MAHAEGNLGDLTECHWRYIPSAHLPRLADLCPGAGPALLSGEPRDSEQRQERRRRRAPVRSVFCFCGEASPRRGTPPRHHSSGRRTRAALRGRWNAVFDK